jgi:uncharacterized protein YecE (DUF72 family)
MSNLKAISQRAACRILVGTSGYSYAEWAEAGFYPPGTRAGEMLPLYARQFGITELNFTWYQLPKAPAIERLMRLAPAGFRFTAKLTRTLTHEVDPGQWRGQAALYREGIAPLVQAGQLSALLLQFPPGFVRDPARRGYLAGLLDEFQGLPLAVEFRHASWAADRVFAELERRCATLVAVDAPALPGLFPRLDVVTNPDLFYIRFHGRNARGWRSGNLQKQFDYDYRDAELRDWVQGPIPRMAARAAGGVIFFNNHVRAQAPRNAAQLQRLLAAAVS